MKINSTTTSNAPDSEAFDPSDELVDTLVQQAQQTAIKDPQRQRRAARNAQRQSRECKRIIRRYCFHFELDRF